MNANTVREIDVAVVRADIMSICAAVMPKKMRQFLPGLKTAGGREWMGFRPSLPDSLPVIGRARASPGIVHAFGHGHLDLTQAAATDRLVRDLLGGLDLSLDRSPFSPRRI